MSRPLLPMLLLIAACGDKDTLDTATPDCDGHGEWNEEHGHCHCDDYYQITSDGEGCEYSGGDTGDTSEDTEDTVFDAASAEATLYDDGKGGLVWILTAKDGTTTLSIENYPDYGGATGPETRTIDATEADYATCGVCVLLQTGCKDHGDHQHCDITYMPEPGGTVTFDTLGDTAGASWAGALADLHLVEVTIDSSTYETTPVDGGDERDIESWSFDTTLTVAQ